MAKKLLLLFLVLLLTVPFGAFAEDLTALEGVIPFEETVPISFARTASSTTIIDKDNPLKKSYTENVWTTTFKDALNIDLTYAWVATDDDSNNAKWGAAIASGELPDAAYVSDAVYKQLLDGSLIMDMTDIYEAEASTLYKSLNTPEILGNLTTGGRMYGLPLPTNKYIGNAVLFVRTDWLAKLNLELPKTIDEAVAVARAFKEAKLGGEDTIGFMFADGSSVNDGRLVGFMNGYGAFRDIWVDVDGKLAWSNTLPEMKDALLALQALYQEGLINQDFAVTNGTVAQEYIASGKCGIFYSTDWTVTTSMQAAVDLDPEADFTCVGIVGLTEDAETKIQTAAVRAGKLFVNAKCAHPEALVRMINLHCAVSLGEDDDLREKYEGGGEDMWYKFLPWNGAHLQSAMNDIGYANDIRMSQDAGEYVGEFPNMKAFVTTCFTLPEGSKWWHSKIGGHNGAYTYDYDMFMAGRMVPDAFNTLPTETMEILGDVVNDALNTAMLEVIMGADISVYENAVKSWFANGGQTITDEVNDWYASR